MSEKEEKRKKKKKKREENEKSGKRRRARGVNTENSKEKKSAIQKFERKKTDSLTSKMNPFECEYAWHSKGFCQL